jgi:hypothetical protein
MRYVRGAAIAVVVLLASVTVVRALTVTFPNRAAARVVAVVDELGHVLFGSTPGKVEVTNFPPSATDAQEVELFDGTVTACSALYTTTIATNGFGHVTLHGASGTVVPSGHVSVSCLFGSTNWAGAAYLDPSPKITGTFANWYLPLPDGAYFRFIQGDQTAVLGPFMGCSLSFDDGSCSGTQASVTLKAWLSR